MCTGLARALRSLFDKLVDVPRHQQLRQWQTEEKAERAVER